MAKEVFTPMEVLVLYNTALVICDSGSVKDLLQKLQKEQVETILGLLELINRVGDENCTVSNPVNFDAIINAWGQRLTELLSY